MTEAAAAETTGPETTGPETIRPETIGPDGPADEYAVVEIFGHRRHVGRILEVERFGAKMLRVDVPKDGTFANGYDTHFYGGAAIFSVTLTDRASVERANRPYAPPARLAWRDPDEDPETPADTPAAGASDGAGGEDPF